jgi:hypothetical protein
VRMGRDYVDLTTVKFDQLKRGCNAPHIFILLHGCCGNLMRAAAAAEEPAASACCHRPGEGGAPWVHHMHAAADIWHPSG